MRHPNQARALPSYLPESVGYPTAPTATIPEDLSETRSGVAPARPYRFRRTLITATLAVSSLLAAEATAGSPAEADSTMHVNIYDTGGEGLWLHSQPGLHGQSDLIHIMPEGSEFAADCYTIATTINKPNAIPNPVWLHGTDSTGATGYASDAYLSTHWSSTNTLKDQGLAICGEQAPPKPNDPPRLK